MIVTETRATLKRHFGEPVASFENANLSPQDKKRGMKKFTWLLFETETKQILVYQSLNGKNVWTHLSESGYLLKVMLDSMNFSMESRGLHGFF